MSCGVFCLMMMLSWTKQKELITNWNSEVTRLKRRVLESVGVLDEDEVPFFFFLLNEDELLVL